MTKKMAPWSQTASGRKLWYDERLETHSEIDIDDIAHHLAMTNRYGGATIYPYSVAQHSVYLAQYALKDTGDPQIALDCLMHDASEYAVTDLRKMLKDQCPEFEKIEDRFDGLIRLRFTSHGLPIYQTPYCKDLDSRIVKDERRQIMVQTEDKWFCDDMEGLEIQIEEWGWQTAKFRFLAMWKSLTEQIAREQAA